MTIPLYIFINDLAKIEILEKTFSIKSNIDTNIPCKDSNTGVQAYTIMRVTGSISTSDITYCQMTSHDNLRINSNINQNITIVIIYFIDI